MQTSAADTSTSLLPVGAVLAFAGPIPTQGLPDGWLLCDGSPYPQSQYNELFGVISSAFGGSSTTFNVPQLGGVFPRCALNANAFATSSRYLTALPRTAWSQSIANLGGEMHHYESGGKNKGTPSHNNNDTRTLTLTSGGDLETRPINKYVYFLIKAKTLTTAQLPVLPPVGSVIAYTGINIATGQYWAPCDGTAEPTEGQFAQLFAAIGFAHGGNAQGQMIMPDYRGYFLRGVDADAGNDPDRGNRTPPYPTGPQSGNSGDDVGSLQSMATALPTQTAFTVGIPCEPLSTNSTAREDTAGPGVIGGYEQDVEDLTQPAGSSGGGGDTETVPQNYAVDYYINTQTSQNPNADNTPIGAIVMFAVAPTTSIPGYLLCDGTSYQQVGAQQQLYAAIQNIYGGTASSGTFNVPDYRGYFLRGTDNSGSVDKSQRTIPSGGDPPVKFGNQGTVQQWYTASPNAQFTGAVSISDDTTDVLTGGSDQCMEAATLSIGPWGGGDPETAPVHLNLSFYIKAST